MPLCSAETVKVEQVIESTCCNRSLHIVFNLCFTHVLFSSFLLCIAYYNIFGRLRPPTLLTFYVCSPERSKMGWSVQPSNVMHPSCPLLEGEAPGPDLVNEGPAGGSN